MVDSGLLSEEKEEGTDGDLSTDVEELGNGTGDGSVLLPETLLDLWVGTLSVGKSLGLGLKSLLGNLGELGEEEGDGDSDTHTGDGHVDVLDSSEITVVLAGEEVLGSDQRTGERGDTVERLRELQSEVGNVVGWHDRDVRVGGDLEGGKTTSDDGGTNDETTEDGLVVSLAGELCDGPEEDGTERVEAETGDDGELVTAALEDFTSDRGVGEVTNTEVSSLKTGGLGFGDVEDRSEVGVQDIEETVGETPEEEQGSNKDESPNCQSARAR